MEKVNCPVCGIEFEKRVHNQKFCSFECRQESYKKYERNCEHCGKLFKTQYKKQRFCSVDCANEELNPSKQKEKVKKEKEKLICPTCGKPFYKKMYNQTFCSRKCRQEAYQKKNKKQVYFQQELKAEVEAKGQIKQPKLKECINCGKPTEGKYCSTNCRLDHEFRLMMKRKAQDNQTLQEIATASESIRMSFNGKLLNGWLSSGFTDSLKEEIKKRDGYRCYICHKETDLHVHHIIPRSQGGPNIPENLITLCSGCHRSIENGDVEKAIKRCVERAVRNVNF